MCYKCLVFFVSLFFSTHVTLHVQCNKGGKMNKWITKHRKRSRCSTAAHVFRIDSRISQLCKSWCGLCMHCESKNMCMSALTLPHALLVSTVNIHGVSQEPSGPISRSQHLCRAASTNTNSACGYKQGKAHQSTIQNHFKLTRSYSPPQLNQRLFFSHYSFGWSSNSANCNL